MRHSYHVKNSSCNFTIEREDDNKFKIYNNFNNNKNNIQLSINNNENTFNEEKNKIIEKLNEKIQK